MMLKIRMKLIRMLAGNEPVLLNYMMNPSLVKNSLPVVYIPEKDDKIKRKSC